MDTVPQLRRAFSYPTRVMPPDLRMVQSDENVESMRNESKKIYKLWKLKRAERFTEDDVRDVFRYFDRDGDGRISVAEMQTVFSGDFTTTDILAMFEEVKTPTQGPVTSPKSPKMEPFELPKSISPLSPTGQHHRHDMELSFDEFYDMVLSTPSDNWCRLISKQLRTALTSDNCLHDEWSKFHLERLEERVGKRLRLDLDTMTWKESSVRVKIDYSKPFASGTMRQCYRFKKMSSHHKNVDVLLRKRHTLWKNQHNYIAKEYIQRDRNTLDTIKTDVTMQMVSKYYAEMFNEYRPSKYVDFLEAWILILHDDKKKEQRIFFAEAFIPGSFKKYSDNLGFVGNVRLCSFGGRIMEDEKKTENNHVKESNAVEISQAFSHFTFETSDRNLVIVDIQGIGELYTDPQIHTVNDFQYLNGPLKAGQTQRCGNLGLAGIGAFMRTHKCGEICMNLKLRNFKSLIPSSFNLDHEARHCCVSHPFQGDRIGKREDEHLYILESYCYEVQESIRSWASICEDSIFQFNLVRYASRSHCWSVVLAILLIYKGLAVSSDFVEEIIPVSTSTFKFSFH